MGLKLTAGLVVVQCTMNNTADNMEACWEAGKPNQMPVKALRSSTESAAVAASGMRNIKIPDGSIMADEVRWVSTESLEF